jgi:hypothetical protein
VTESDMTRDLVPDLTHPVTESDMTRDLVPDLTPAWTFRT